jgi:type I restriction enzyme S subunit
MLSLLPAELRRIQALLRRYIPDREVRLFGSRAKGSTKSSSDADLAIMGEIAPSRVVISNLASAFSDSDLPFRVDLLIWANTSAEFRGVIEEAYEIIQKPSL